MERIHQISLDSSNYGSVMSCDVAGSYGVLLLQEGVGLLRLHEEQSEQLMEAGMSMDDEQSFTANDSGAILTLDWPQLDQQVSTSVAIHALQPLNLHTMLLGRKDHLYFSIQGHQWNIYLGGHGC